MLQFRCVQSALWITSWKTDDNPGARYKVAICDLAGNTLGIWLGETQGGKLDKHSWVQSQDKRINDQSQPTRKRHLVFKNLRHFKDPGFWAYMVAGCLGVAGKASSHKKVTHLGNDLKNASGTSFMSEHFLMTLGTDRTSEDSFLQQQDDLAMFLRLCRIKYISRFGIFRGQECWKTMLGPHTGVASFPFCELWTFKGENKKPKASPQMEPDLG